MKKFIKSFVINFIGLAVVLWIMSMFDSNISFTVSSLPFLLIADFVLAVINGLIDSQDK